MVDLYTLADITIRSVLISGSAALLATSWSIPIALVIATGESRASKIAIDVFNTLVGIPTVLIGLLLYLLLSRAGPLGFLNMLYTPYAIVLGQAILITPLVVSMACEVVSGRGSDIIELARVYGAGRIKTISTVYWETYPRLIGVSILGFQRAIGELGVALMLGGNIRGLTRVYTTAIALEIQKGEYELAIYLGLILLIIDMLLILVIRLIGVRG